MKIKLAILETDQSYLNRFVSVLNTKYADNFEIYSFTNLNVALFSLDESRIDVFIATETFEIDVNKLPNRCGFAYLVDSAHLNMFRNQKAIGKFQKVELIYREILSIYSEHAGSISGFRQGDSTTTLLAFSPVSGGCGSSIMAAACALHFATQGKKTLYLNLERFGSANSFFSGEGQFGMSDIIFALKSKKSNFSLKLESCVRQDPRGVFFVSQSKFALDMLELNSDDLLRLIFELQQVGLYDPIILDFDFALDKKMLEVYRQAHALVWVGDGSEISNAKISRAFTAIKTLEQNTDIPLTSKLALLYNKFSNKTSKPLTDIDVKTIGGAPKYEHATTSQVLGQLASMNVFDKLLEDWWQ